ncbi:MAG TPA: hypothetical protein VFB51_06660 [Solirubrobacterales bacterium]|nr:hypothetical protein [Solirubrobacterales bacterium]
MRGKLGILLGVLVFAAGLLSWSAPAMADSVTTLGSFSDPRTAMKQRPGHIIKRIRYGQTASQNFVLNPGQSIHNTVRFDAPAPCTNCHITDMVPSLVYNGDANNADGTVANLNNDAMLHHFVLINGGRADTVCPGGLQGQLGERFFAAGNERSQMHLPDPFGYLNNSSQWRLISHIINKSTTVAKSYQIEVVYQYRTTGGAEAKPLWLDIDGCQDSEYTTPVGYNDATVNWTSTVSGRMIGMSGHLHDVDITNAAPCTNHCPEKGHGIAVSAEVVGGNANDYYGPLPPNNPPPASLTGATMCRSEGYYGTPWAGSRYRGHLDTMTECEVPGGLAPTHQVEAWPAGGEYPSTGYPFSAGQVIRLHSEYQNDTGQPQTDVMGIMMAWYVPTSPGYVRPKSASSARVSLVPAFNACTTPNRIHGPPDYPGNASNPDGSCNPPVASSSQLTIGTPDSNGAALNSQGFVKTTAITGNPATQADEADARFNVSLTDVRRTTSGLPDYTGQLQLDTSIRVVDKNNGPSEVGTMQDTPFRVTIPCAATGSTTVGSTCSVNTTADAVIGAGSIQEGKRTMWQLGQVRVNDGGADGVASTTPNSPFMVQGVMVP